MSVMMNGGDEAAQIWFDDGNTMLYLMDLSVQEKQSVPYNARTVLLGEGNGVWVYAYFGTTDLPGMQLLGGEKQELFKTMLNDRETIGPEAVTFF